MSNRTPPPRNPTTLRDVARDVAREIDIAVIGAGQAGLSAGYFLRRAGYRPGESFVMFDHSPAPGGAWQFRWPTLTFDTVHGIHQLPGSQAPQADPAASVAESVPGYFGQYEEANDLRVHRPVNVDAVHNHGDGRLRLVTDDGTWLARGLINATGTWDKPFIPYYPGMADFGGRQLHTVDYRGPGEFSGQRVIIVGGGASAIQLLIDIADVADTTWVTRREVTFSSRPFDADWGRMVEASVGARVAAGLPPRSVISETGYHLTPQISRALEQGVLHRRSMFSRILPQGVAWDDGSIAEADVIIWCTGFRAALDHLAPLGLRSARGGITMDGTKVAADPRIHLVGYGPSASTIGANRAGRAAVRELTGWLRQESAPAIADGSTVENLS